MVTNQTTITGPNRKPMRSVPRDWITNRLRRMTMAIGTTYGSNRWVVTLRPSTALSTETAGVIMPSP